MKPYRRGNTGNVDWYPQRHEYVQAHAYGRPRNRSLAYRIERRARRRQWRRS